MLLSNKEKYTVYDEIKEKYDDSSVSLKEEESGFPDVSINVEGEPSYITDAISVEKWYAKRQNLHHYIVYPTQKEIGKKGGYGVMAKDKAESIKKAEKYYGSKLIDPKVIKDY